MLTDRVHLEPLSPERLHNEIDNVISKINKDARPIILDLQIYAENTGKFKATGSDNESGNPIINLYILGKTSAYISKQLAQETIKLDAFFGQYFRAEQLKLINEISVMNQEEFRELVLKEAASLNAEIAMQTEEFNSATLPFRKFGT